MHKSFVVDSPRKMMAIFWNGLLNADSYTNPGMLGFRVLNLAEVDHANFRYLCHSRDTFPNLSRMPHQESLKIKLNSLVLTLLIGLHFRVSCSLYAATNVWHLKLDWYSIQLQTFGS